jgi:hypothetical protein
MTDTISITDMVRALETERDDLRARVAELASRCAAQELVIRKAHELLRALDDYAERHAQPEEPAPPKRGKRNRRMGRRYTDDDVRRWQARLQAGEALREVAREEDVDPSTIMRRVRAVATEAIADSLAPPPMAPTTHDRVHTCAQRGRFTDVQVLEAGERMRRGMSAEEAARFFYTDLATLQAGLRRLEMDEATGKFLHRPSEEELLRSESPLSPSDEEEPEDERIAEAV